MFADITQWLTFFAEDPQRQSLSRSVADQSCCYQKYSDDPQEPTGFLTQLKSWIEEDDS